MPNNIIEQVCKKFEKEYGAVWMLDNNQSPLRSTKAIKVNMAHFLRTSIIAALKTRDEELVRLIEKERTIVRKDDIGLYNGLSTAIEIIKNNNQDENTK